MALLGIANLSLFAPRWSSVSCCGLMIQNSFLLKPRCESESCSVEQTSNWNGSKIDPCDFVLRVVWGSALYEGLRSGFGARGGVCVNWQALLGVRSLEFGYSKQSLRGNGVQLPWLWLQIKALLKEPHKVFMCYWEKIVNTLATPHPYFPQEGMKDIHKYTRSHKHTH